MRLYSISRSGGTRYSSCVLFLGAGVMVQQRADVGYLQCCRQSTQSSKQRLIITASVYRQKQSCCESLCDESSGVAELQLAEG